ncbi:MAG: hypothetical protein H7Y86_10215 [Rhizobacter sp.]|nr:hypothetical protein [Ferruginibacter sp.]
MVRTNILKGLFFFSVISCTEKKRDADAHVPGNITDTAAILNNKNLSVRLSEAAEIDSSGVVLFPLQVEEKEGRNSYGSGSVSYKDIPYNSYWNIAFYNSLSGEYHLLSEQKMLILKYGASDYAATNSGVDNKSVKGSIFYEIVTIDHNMDKVYNSEDPIYLYMSDTKGYNLKQLSPVGLSLSSWHSIKGSNKIIMRVIKDSDNNKKFERNDEVLAYEVDLLKDSVAKEIFSTEFTNKLKILFDRDWKRIKK